MIVHKTMKLYDFESGTYRTVHNAWINGQMADGSKTWAFDEMDEDGCYLAFRGKDNKLYLCRQ